MVIPSGPTLFRSSPRSYLGMLLLWLLLLLPLLAVLWQQRPSWLILLRHQVAWRVLAWEAAWQQRKLEQSTLRAGQSQQQALVWCLKRAQSPCCLPRGITGAVLTPGGSDPKRKSTHTHQSLEPKGPRSFTTNTLWPDPEPHHSSHLILLLRWIFLCWVLFQPSPHFPDPSWVPSSRVSTFFSLPEEFLVFWGGPQT